METAVKKTTQKKPPVAEMKQEPSIFVSVIENENSDSRPYPVSQTIPLIDVIYEEDDKGMGMNRRIRYVQGEKSIYVEDQKSVSEKFVPEPITMREGFFAVYPTEVSLMDFLKKCNYNSTNPVRMAGRSIIFRELEKEREAQEFIETERDYFELIGSIFHMDADELEAIAMILGDSNADKKKTDEIRRDVLVFAKNNPEKFADSMEKADNKYKVYVMRSFKKRILIFDSKTNEVMWENGDLLARIPVGRNAEDHVTRMVMGNNALFEQLKEMLNPPIPMDKQVQRQMAEQAKATEQKTTEPAGESKRLDIPNAAPPFTKGKRPGLKADEATYAIAKKAVDMGILKRPYSDRKELGLRGAPKESRYYDTGKRNAVGIANIMHEDPKFREIIENEVNNGTNNG
jgi:hypothetical protein